MRRIVVSNKLPGAVTRDQICGRLEEAMHGSRKVRITFRKDTVDYVKFLLGMALPVNGLIDLGADELVVRCIVDSRNWDGDHNRTMTITLTGKFNETEFVGRLQHALEEIEVVS